MLGRRAARGGRQLLLLSLMVLFELPRDLAPQVRRFGQHLIELFDQIGKLFWGKRLRGIRHDASEGT